MTPFSPVSFLFQRWITCFLLTHWVTETAQPVCTCSLHDHNRLTHFLLLIQTSPVMLMSKRRVCLKWWHNICLFY